MEYKMLFKVLERELMRDRKSALILKEMKFSSQKSPDNISIELPQNVKDFYKEIDSFKLEWTAKNVMYNEDAYVVGGGYINTWQEMWQEWDKIYFPNPKDEEYRKEYKNFKVLGGLDEGSFFGYYHDGSKRENIHYQSRSTMGMYALNLDFAGFIEMMIASRSIAYWPQVILYLRGDLKEDDYFKNHAEQFQKIMPKLFPDFKWEDFVALYEKVRIK